MQPSLNHDFCAQVASELREKLAATLARTSSAEEQLHEERLRADGICQEWAEKLDAAERRAAELEAGAAVRRCGPGNYGPCGEDVCDAMDRELAREKQERVNERATWLEAYDRVYGWLTTATAERGSALARAEAAEHDRDRALAQRAAAQQAATAEAALHDITRGERDDYQDLYRRSLNERQDLTDALKAVRAATNLALPSEQTGPEWEQCVRVPVARLAAIDAAVARVLGEPAVTGEAKPALHGGEAGQ